MLTAFLAVTGLRAEVILSEGFTYPDGSLVGAPGSAWGVHSGTTGPVLVSSGVAGLSRSNTEDVNVVLPGGPYASGGAVTSLYVGFTVRFSELPSAGGTYFAHFNYSSSNFRCVTWASTANAAAGCFRLGVGNRSTANASSGQFPTDLFLNTKYLVVMRCDLATGVSTIWLNPVAENDLNVSASDVTSAVTLSAMAFRQNSGMGTLVVDDLVVGTAFSDIVNTDLPPAISTIPTQHIVASADTGLLEFVVGDDRTPLNELAVSGASDNQTLVPDGNIVFGGSGGNRTIIVTPAAGQQGAATISLSVNDGSATASSSFLLTVGAPTIEPIANQIIAVDTLTGPIPVVIADAEEQADTLTMTVSSSNQALVPDGNCVAGGSGANRSLSITPTAGTTGLAVITINVDDGFQTTSTTFALTVHPVLGLIFGDDFNRADGGLVDEINWFNHSGFYGETMITGNRLALSQYLTEDANHWLDSWGSLFTAEAGHVFYAGFKVNFSELPAGNGTYLAHFKDDVLFAHRARVFASTNNASEGCLQLGITSASGDPLHAAMHSANLATNVDHVVVVRFNAATGESRLWVNPSAEGAGFVDSTDAPQPAAVQAFAFRQSGTTHGMGVLAVDDLKVGTAFADVVGELPVALSRSLQGNTLRLSWPAGRGFILQYTPTLPATGWSSIPFINEGANDISNVDVASGNGFFRLLKPTP